MRTYKAFYKEKTAIVYAESSFEAQQRAAKEFRAKKRYDVTVVLADVPVNTASI
jgi:chorismate synthase